MGRPTADVLAEGLRLALERPEVARGPIRAAAAAGVSEGAWYAARGALGLSVRGRHERLAELAATLHGARNGAGGGNTQGFLEGSPDPRLTISHAPADGNADVPSEPAGERGRAEAHPTSGSRIEPPRVEVAPPLVVPPGFGCRIGRVLPAPEPREPGTAPRGRRHLVIGDAHAKPGQDLRRFQWLGRMIRDLAPDVVVSIGDWACMPSLSHYDERTRRSEGRRLADDCMASQAALDHVHREAGSALDAAERVWTCGNHEQRLDRLTDTDAKLHGLCTYDDLGFAQRGWLCIPFLQPHEIDGVWYAHYFTAQGTGRPIGGVNAARALVLAQHASVVAGHSHVYSHYGPHKGDPGGRRRIHGLVAGCYFEEREGYAGQSNEGWWRGIVVLEDVRDGDFMPQPWTLERIAREWGTARERVA